MVVQLRHIQNNELMLASKASGITVDELKLISEITGDQLSSEELIDIYKMYEESNDTVCAYCRSFVAQPLYQETEQRTWFHPGDAINICSECGEEWEEEKPTLEEWLQGT